MAARFHGQQICQRQNPASRHGGATALPHPNLPRPDLSRAVREPCRPLSPRPSPPILELWRPGCPTSPVHEVPQLQDRRVRLGVHGPLFATPRSTATPRHPGRPDRPDRADRADRPRSCTLVPRKPREWDARRARTARSPGPRRALSRPPRATQPGRHVEPAPAWSIMSLAAFGVRFVAAKFMIGRQGGMPSLASDRAGRRSWCETAPVGAIWYQDLRLLSGCGGRPPGEGLRDAPEAGPECRQLVGVVSGPACG